MCRLGVACSLDLVVLRASKGDAEESDNVSVSCSAVHIGLNDRLLFADQTAQLVSGHVHTVEIGQAVVTLDVLHTQLNLSPRDGLVLVEVSEGNFNNTSLQSIGSNLLSLRLGDQSLSAVLDGKDGRGNELVPFFLQEGVDGLFASSLLGFRKSLILALWIKIEKGRETERVR